MLHIVIDFNSIGNLMNKTTEGVFYNGGILVSGIEMTIGSIEVTDFIMDCRECIISKS